MRIFLVCVSLLLAACNTPSPAFYQTKAVTYSVQDSRFLIRQKGALAEVTRTSPEWLPRFPDVAARATVALAAVTGCDVGWIDGDPAMMLAGLSCNGAEPPPKPKPKEILICDAQTGFNRGQEVDELTCYRP